MDNLIELTKIHAFFFTWHLLLLNFLQSFLYMLVYFAARLRSARPVPMHEAIFFLFIPSIHIEFIHPIMYTD